MIMSDSTRGVRDMVGFPFFYYYFFFTVIMVRVSMTWLSRGNCKTESKNKLLST